ncbi:hypothetical protein POM88_028751 [Heracleum sosnowskyi]|uniref:Helitron helicase-like domain-containing protein n=1 Tax=Heracleum sosnowskyi TaxID=360622 RepID=A0AAD8MHW7_9APIA|nr:hypothetical protein POM88_028751 [Heracleum sosnowskyi]
MKEFNKSTTAAKNKDKQLRNDGDKENCTPLSTTDIVSTFASDVSNPGSVKRQYKPRTNALISEYVLNKKSNSLLCHDKEVTNIEAEPPPKRKYKPRQKKDSSSDQEVRAQVKRKYTPRAKVVQTDGFPASTDCRKPLGNMTNVLNSDSHNHIPSFSSTITNNEDVVVTTSKRINQTKFSFPESSRSLFSDKNHRGNLNESEIDYEVIEHSVILNEEFDEELFVEDECDLADDMNLDFLDDGLESNVHHIPEEYATLGAPTCICLYCGAYMWKEERVNKNVIHGTPMFSLCCGRGQICLPKALPAPTYLQNLYNDAEKDGYHADISFVDRDNNGTKKRTKVSMREFYSYMLQVRAYESYTLRLGDDIKKKSYFGVCVGLMYVVEFQKRGLPHVHMLICLDSNSKKNLIANVDKFVSAEIPDPVEDPVGYEAVKAFMIHGPCGAERMKSPCMKDFKCICHFPKKYCARTTYDECGFPIYKRRNTGITVKYCLKGHDRATIHIRGRKKNTQTEDKDVVVDEISEFLDGRYICGAEASYRIFGFDIHYRSVSVERLSFHLPNAKNCSFRANENLSKVADRSRWRPSKLEAFFQLNLRDNNARQYTYDEIPRFYVWNDTDCRWTSRKKGMQIGRISYTHHSSGEAWYLRLLLLTVRGPTSFEHLKTINGIQYNTFREACKEYGLLDDDSEWHEVLSQCASCGFPTQIRQLFVHVMVNCKVTDLKKLWESHWTNMVDDILYKRRSSTGNPNLILNEKQLQYYALAEIHSLLSSIVPKPSDGMFEYNEDDIQIPEEYCNFQNNHSIDNMISNVYPDMIENLNNPDYWSERAILTPVNQTVSHLNSQIVDQIPGEYFSYFSVDTAEDFGV